MCRKNIKKKEKAPVEWRGRGDMIEIIGVRFKEVGKIYHFDPQGIEVEVGDKVIVDTVRGVECGVVAIKNRQMPKGESFHTLRPMVRKATAQDLANADFLKTKEANVLERCREKVAEHGLDMQLIDADYTFDGSKILFYFTAEGRVDFRNLVRELASMFKARIELRQIGVRDEAKMMGGLGVCGREFCCATFLSEFAPVSVKMAKDQGLSLNPSKISGNCGRLMCCLRYEQDAYEYLTTVTPKVGSYVNTPEGKGYIQEVSLLRGTVKVKLDKVDLGVKSFSKGDIAVLRQPSYSQDSGRGSRGGREEATE